MDHDPAVEELVARFAALRAGDRRAVMTRLSPAVRRRLQQALRTRHEAEEEDAAPSAVAPALSRALARHVRDLLENADAATLTPAARLLLRRNIPDAALRAAPTFDWRMARAPSRERRT